MNYVADISPQTAPMTCSHPTQIATENSTEGEVICEDGGRSVEVRDAAKEEWREGEQGNIATSSWVWGGSDWRVRRRRSRVTVKHTEARIEVIWTAETLVEEGGKLLSGYRLKVRLEPQVSNGEGGGAKGV